MMTTTPVETISAISRSEAEQLATTEYSRLLDQLRSLDVDDWTRPTDCPLWDVRAMAGHCVGMQSDLTSLRSMMRRMLTAAKAAKTTGDEMVDAMSAQQVADCAPLTTAELIARSERDGPAAARWRSKPHRLLRRMPIKEAVGGKVETWHLAYLFDIILTRDPWMHRVDISRATGREMVHTAGHDGRIVADVVAEWARRHGRPFVLTLTGPAGGNFVGGNEAGGTLDGDTVAAEEITMDAVEFCRTLSGRARGNGLLAQEVPF